MKPITEWTDEELSREHDAASYIANASDDTEEVRGAVARISEIEAECDRRESSAKRAPLTGVDRA